MNRNRIAIAAIFIVAVAAIAMYSVRHQTPDKVPTIAIFNLVSYPILDASVAGIKDELASQGYVGDKVRFIEINANGQMQLLNAYAQELLASNPDVIIPVSTPVTQAVVKEAAAAQAIVYSTVTNPDDVGMSKHPPNLTGVSDAVNYEANIDLIQELFPNADTIGVIYNAGERNSQFGVKRTQEIAKQRNLTILLATVSGSGEVNDAARSLSDRVDVFYVGSDNTVVSALDSLLSVAKERQIPVIASDTGSVEKGALAAVSVDYNRVGREAGKIVAQILDTGTQAGQIKPVFVHGNALILNEKASQVINFEFPKAVVGRASRTIQ